MLSLHRAVVLVLGLGLAAIASPNQAGAGPSGKWIQLTPAHSPAARWGASAAYDPHGKRILLFGGSTATGWTNEVWQLSLGCTPDWSQDSTSGTPPSQRYYASTIYDPARTQLVVFGGTTADGDAGGFGGDTWALSVGSGSPTWTRLDGPTLPPTGCYVVNGGTKPCPRDGHASIWNSSTGTMWMFAGENCEGERYDTWYETLDGQPNSWHLQSANSDCSASYYDNFQDSLPSLRMHHSLVYDAHNMRAVLFGGQYGGQYKDDAWYWVGSPHNQEWAHLPSAGYTRTDHVAVYDSLNARMIVFGGQIGGASPPQTQDLYLGTPAQWSALSPAGTAPPTYVDAAGAFDAAGRQLIVFGTDGATWALNFDTTAPSAVSDLGVKSGGPSYIYLKWTAPGGDGSTGQACTYDIRYSTAEITDANFASATHVVSPPRPSPSGAKDSVRVSGLTSGQTYWFALKSADFAGNVSSLSNTICIIPGVNLGECGGNGFRAGPVDLPQSGTPVLGIRGVRAEPAARDLVVSFTLSSDEPARLDLIDVAGRRLGSTELGGLGTGDHEVRLGGGTRLAGGVYFVRLRQGASAVTRSAVVRP